MKLEAILKWKMTQKEAIAFKVSLIWQEIMRQEFPNYQCVRLRQKGDPRKSLLFKYCFKLIKETEGILQPMEYRLYVLSQIQIMGRMCAEDSHAMISPQILCGPKAWKRWRWWKEKHEKNMKLLVAGSKIEPSTDEMKNEFLKTKILLENQNIKELFASKKIHEWLATDKISPYFILLNPEIQECLDGKNIIEVFNRDLGIYVISDEIKKIYDEYF